MSSNARIGPRSASISNKSSWKINTPHKILETAENGDSGRFRHTFVSRSGNLAPGSSMTNIRAPSNTVSNPNKANAASTDRAHPQLNIRPYIPLPTARGATENVSLDNESVAAQPTSQGPATKKSRAQKIHLDYHQRFMLIQMCLTARDRYKPGFIMRWWHSVGEDFNAWLGRPFTNHKRAVELICAKRRQLRDLAGPSLAIPMGRPDRAIDEWTEFIEEQKRAKAAENFTWKEKQTEHTRDGDRRAQGASTMARQDASKKEKRKSTFHGPGRSRNTQKNSGDESTEETLSDFLNLEQSRLNAAQQRNIYEDRELKILKDVGLKFTEFCNRAGGSRVPARNAERLSRVEERVDRIERLLENIVAQMAERAARERLLDRKLDILFKSNPLLDPDMNHAGGMRNEE